MTQTQIDAEALASVLRHGSLRAAAQATGVNYRTLQARARRARNKPGERPRKKQLPDALQPDRISDTILYPDLPPSDLPIDELIAQRCRRFKVLRKRRDAEKWFRIKLAETKPFAIVAFGDPHLDDDSCDLPQFIADATTCATTPGMYGLNIGDATNNWVGRLTKKYADQTTTLEQARRLASAFMNDMGVRWLCHLVGNHDAWEHGAAILGLIKNRPEVPLLDWRAQFVLEFPTGKELRVDAAHDFRGKSQDNPLAGPAKAAIRQSPADVFLCGHQHHGAVMKMPIGGEGRVVALTRSRGYKSADEYAWKNGFDETDYCPSAVVVVDPNADRMGKQLQVFDDVQLAAEYLTFTRSR